jgi:hypothetical protein
MGALILAGCLRQPCRVRPGPRAWPTGSSSTSANGMTVLMVERHQAPIVSVNMTFGVGV